MNNSETQSEKEQKMLVSMKTEMKAVCSNGPCVYWEREHDHCRNGDPSADVSLGHCDAWIPIAHDSYDWSTFKAIRKMRDVHRLSGIFTTRIYTDAEHCYYTGLLFVAMAHAHKVNVTEEMIVWVFTHDALEVATGDLLYPAKNTNQETQGAWALIEKAVVDNTPSLEGYSDIEGMRLLGGAAWDLFKACDALELWLCCTEERNRGNVLLNMDGGTVEAAMYRYLKDVPFEHIREAVHA
jgi:5'-deoxynucleotidase YfbR-like HD superfamily hydrolase